jgi:hypothetical protein
VSGTVDRATKRLLRQRVLSLFLLCALTFWFAVMAGTYRTSNRLSALTILVGVIVLAFDLLLLVRRVSNATPSEMSTHLFEVAGRYAPLVVLNLIMLNVLAPVLGYIASLMPKMSLLKTGLTLLGWLSAQFLFGFFVLGVAGVLAVMAMRLLDRAVLRWRSFERAVGVGDRAIVVLTALYLAWAMLLTFNGSFDRGTVTTEHRSEILRVWGVPGSSTLWWADVRSWEASGGLKRVLIFPERDQVVPKLLSEGQHVRVRIRTGYFGLPWVESMRLDFEHEIEPLVAAAPSAATPRRQLIDLLLRDGRWAEAAAQTAIYARYHPGDRELVRRVTSELRAAKQAEPVAELDRMVVPVSQTRGTR